MIRLVPSVAVLSAMVALSIFAPSNAQAQNFHFQCPGCETVGGGPTVYDDVFYVFTVETTSAYDFYATATAGGTYEYFFSLNPDPMVWFASALLTNASNPNTFVGSVNLTAGTEYFVRAEMLEDCTQQNLNCQTTLKMQLAGTPPPTEVVPEPLSMVLLGTGLAGVAAMRRRRKATEE